MVCEKCQLKTTKVITPDVARKPLYKQAEETKSEVPRPKHISKQSDEIDFSEVTT